MRLNRWVSVFAGLLALSSQLPSASAQTDEEKAAARSLAKEGAEALAAGKNAEALDLMSRAEAILHAPPHVLYIARAQAALGKLVAARENYLKVIREELPATAPKAFKDAQAQAKEEIATIEPKIASLRITVDGAGGAKVNVKLDGQPVSAALIGVHRPIDPGKHTVTAYPIGKSPVEQQVELGEGEKKDVKLSLTGGGTGSVSGVPVNSADDPDAGSQTPPQPDKKSGGGMNTLMIAGIAGAGVGVAGVVVGALFTVKWSNLGSDADAKFHQYGCDLKPIVGPECTKDRQNEIDGIDKNAASAGTIGVIGLAAGGALLAGGATVFVLGLRKQKADKTAAPPPAAWIVPYVTPSSFGVTGTF